MAYFFFAGPLTHGGSLWVPAPIGLPEDSVLGPILYMIYAADLGSLLTAGDVLSQSYADDLQAYIHLHGGPGQCNGWINEPGHGYSAALDVIKPSPAKPVKTQLIWLDTPPELSKI